jgi:hypothetical protein
MLSVRMTGKADRKIWIHIWTLHLARRRTKFGACRGAGVVEATFVPIRLDHHWSPKETLASNLMTEGSSTPLIRYIIAQSRYGPEKKHCRSIVRIPEECSRCFSS